MAHVEIRDVRKTYGKTEVVHGLDLEIQDREFIVILGPSGCGKSTLLRMIAGLEAITGGEILIDGQVVNRLEPRERSCAMVFQNYALYPHMTVAENIGYALKVAGVARTEREARVKEVATTMQLDAYLGRKPAQLSGGQRQRVAMGRAIIREPKVFLFDEPLSNLDAMLRVQMRLEIRRLHQRLNATSIFVTHDQVEAMTLADRLVVMRDGWIEQVGRPGELYHKPATRFVASFIGAPPMNLIEPSSDPALRPLLQAASSRLGPNNASSCDWRLGLRPEHIGLVAAADHLPRARLELVEELGDRRVCYLSLGQQPVVAIAVPGASLTLGATVGLRIDPGNLHIFEPSGKVAAGPEPAETVRFASKVA